MEFEVTDVVDSPANRRRICIEKQVTGFPHFFLPTKDHIYEGFHAELFRHSRDKAFGYIAEQTSEVLQRRRFIQNETFIADSLEIVIPRDIQRDLGYRQHVNLSLVQIRGVGDPSQIREPATEDEKDCMDAVHHLYDQNGLSKNLFSYRLVEALVLKTPDFLKDKKPQYRVIANKYGFVINYRSYPDNGNELFTYALGIKHKR